VRAQARILVRKNITLRADNTLRQRYDCQDQVTSMHLKEPGRWQVRKKEAAGSWQRSARLSCAGEDDTSLADSARKPDAPNRMTIYGLTALISSHATARQLLSSQMLRPSSAVALCQNFSHNGFLPPKHNRNSQTTHDHFMRRGTHIEDRETYATTVCPYFQFAGTCAVVL
jgi:hypothetical protein